MLCLASLLWVAGTLLTETPVLIHFYRYRYQSRAVSLLATKLAEARGTEGRVGLIVGPSVMKALPEEELDRLLPSIQFVNTHSLNLSISLERIGARIVKRSGVRPDIIVMDIGLFFTDMPPSSQTIRDAEYTDFVKLGDVDELGLGITADDPLRQSVRLNTLWPYGRPSAQISRDVRRALFETRSRMHEAFPKGELRLEVNRFELAPGELALEKIDSGKPPPPANAIVISEGLHRVAGWGLLDASRYENTSDRVFFDIVNEYKQIARRVIVLVLPRHPELTAALPISAQQELDRTIAKMTDVCVVDLRGTATADVFIDLFHFHPAYYRELSGMVARGIAGCLDSPH